MVRSTTLLLLVAAAVAGSSLTIGVADAFIRVTPPTSGGAPQTRTGALRMTATEPQQQPQQQQRQQPQHRSEQPASRRAAALQQLGQLGLGAGVVVSGAWLGLGLGAPGGAQAAKKITNLEEARERGERKMEEIEKSKGPLIKLRDGAWVLWGVGVRVCVREGA